MTRPNSQAKSRGVFPAWSLRQGFDWCWSSISLCKHTQYNEYMCVCVCVYSWLFMCIYSLLHNGRVVMRGVKGSVPHLIGCWLMTRPWAAFSWAHTCPAKQRNVRAACLQKKRMVVWMKNKCNTIQKCGDSIFFFLNRNKKTIILNSIQINTPLVSIRDLSVV